LKKINLYLVEFAINSLLRQKWKNIFIVVIFTLLIAILSSIFQIASSIRYELNLSLNSLPDIFVQKIKAGKLYDIKTDRVDKILEIKGVQSAKSRVWGYYYFENAGVNFSVVGIDQYQNQYKKTLQKLVSNIDFDKLEKNSSMVVGVGVKRILEQNYYTNYFNFIRPDGTIKKVYIAGVFDSNISLEANDMMVMSQETFRDIFQMKNSFATDIVIEVPNKNEIPTVATKIKLLYPDTRVLTKEDLKISYQNIFDYKQGLFLALFIISIFTFFIIVYDKLSGLNSQEKREIGILRAVGWSMEDILKERFYEASIISILSFILGYIISLYYVYILKAPLLRGVFEGYSKLRTDFNLMFHFDSEIAIMLFLLTVPIYIGANIIPAWIASSIDIDEVIK
jgi:ABC-type lipoprotein release transport system permease subunit